MKYFTPRQFELLSENEQIFYYNSELVIPQQSYLKIFSFEFSDSTTIKKINEFVGTHSIETNFAKPTYWLFLPHIVMKSWIYTVGTQLACAFFSEEEFYNYAKRSDNTFMISNDAHLIKANRYYVKYYDYEKTCYNKNWLLF